MGILKKVEKLEKVYLENQDILLKFKEFCDRINKGEEVSEEEMDAFLKDKELAKTINAIIPIMKEIIIEVKEFLGEEETEKLLKIYDEVDEFFKAQ